MSETTASPKRMVLTSIRLPPEHAAWLKELARLEGVTVSGWLRRTIKVSAQCANLPSALVEKKE